jgi:hypothetical protein
MSAGDGTLEHRRLRAPREHGATLIEPPLAAVDALLTRNRERRRRYVGDILGRPLADLCFSARQDLLHAAQAYTSQYRDATPPTAAGPVLLAGHQPELFHPGVWFKNFALGRLARDHGGVGINLVIDSDTLKQAALRVPGGSVESPVVETVPLDRPTEEIPFEERSVVDRELLASFGQRAADVLFPLVPDPLVRDFWPLVRRRAAATSNLGECLAQSRHSLEGQWGLSTLELPQSHVCGLPAFHWFTAHVLAHLSRFSREYNGAVRTYRRTNHIRSASHPVPDLAADGEWLEAPFWLWTSESPRRRRLFASAQGQRLVLTDRRQVRVELPLSVDGQGGAAVDVLADLPRRGIKLRSRALLTTLFARLVLGDLFLHGIGGAKYDQLTDWLFERFFGLVPPEFMVLSATLHLPLAGPRVAADEIPKVDRQLWELRHHPERFLRIADLPQAAAAEASGWLASKSQWVADDSPDRARERCQHIRRANESLQPWLESTRQGLLAQRERLAGAFKAQRVLTSREYSFCLYPAKTLRDFLLAFLSGRP